MSLENGSFIYWIQSLLNQTQHYKKGMWLWLIYKDIDIFQTESAAD